MDSGRDAYCCICGGPLYTVGWRSQPRAEEQRPSHSYDPSIILPGSPVLDWLSDVRLIGEIWKGPGEYLTYVSGPARVTEGSVFDAEPGEDTDFPSEERRLTTYSWGEEYPLIFPFHHPCYRVLCAAAQVKELDKQVLYATLTDLYHPEGNAKMLSVEYGVVEDLQGTHWEVEWGTEHVVFSPTDIPELATYYENLPRMTTQVNQVSSVTVALGPVSRLAPETQLAILGYLDIPSLLRLQTVSKSTSAMPGNFFWWTHLKRDMPWLYDLPKFSDAQEGSPLDWKQIYKDLHIASRETGERRMLGLVNRRRIWELPVADILADYTERMEDEEELEEAKSDAAEDEE